MGRADAFRLAKLGADVVVVDLYSSPELFPEEQAEGWQGLESVVSEIEAEGRRALAITADITKNQDVNRMVETTLIKFGKIDILVNNAGLSQKRIPIIDTDEELWQKIITTNLTGPFLCSKAVAKVMIEQRGGKIINISSTAGRQGSPGTAPYSCSKFGLIGLTQVLAQELAPYKINVNAICPGPITTDLMKVISPSSSYNAALEKLTVEFSPLIPLGRLGTPEDVANVVAFLASSESDYLTGQAINVSGGRIMN
jgi:NAD(P)-dependent dehydrogenase (short-subunit alcohol dehydrogenase family)